MEPEGQRNLDALNRYTQLDFEPFDPRTKRTQGKLQAPDGSIFRISKVGLVSFLVQYVVANGSWSGTGCTARYT